MYVSLDPTRYGQAGLERFRRVIDPLRSRAARRHSLVGPAHLWKMKRAFQIAFLRKHGLMPHHRLMDVGCGTLRGGIPLIDYLLPGHYAGLDVREEALAEGQRELAEAGLEHKQPQLVVSSELESLELAHEYDFAWAFAVLIHMRDEIAGQCMEMVSRNLRLGGRFFANVHFGERSDGAWREFPVVFRSYDFYASMAERNGLKLEVLGTLASLGHRCGKSGDETWMLELTRTS